MSRGTMSLRCWLIAAALSLHSAAVMSQAPCAVLDPELQGAYTGGCKDGLAEGRGEARGTASYTGEFKAGRKHGKGVKTWPSGDRYEGDFVEDRKEGKGTYAWGDRTQWAGEQYSGDFKNDRRHGFGTYEWPGGDRYTGPWENDVITGPATSRMIARERAHAEQVAAVSRVGARVCRDFRVGTAIKDRVRGTVTGVGAGTIRVRIDDPGQFEHVLGNVLIAKGATVQDSLAAWVRCN